MGVRGGVVSIWFITHSFSEQIGDLRWKTGCWRRMRGSWYISFSQRSRKGGGYGGADFRACNAWWGASVRKSLIGKELCLMQRGSEWKSLQIRASDCTWGAAR